METRQNTQEGATGSQQSAEGAVPESQQNNQGGTAESQQIAEGENSQAQSGTQGAAGGSNSPSVNGQEVRSLASVHFLLCLLVARGNMLY